MQLQQGEEGTKMQAGAPAHEQHNALIILPSLRRDVRQVLEYFLRLTKHSKHVKESLHSESSQGTESKSSQEKEEIKLPSRRRFGKKIEISLKASIEHRNQQSDDEESESNKSMQ